MTDLAGVRDETAQKLYWGRFLVSGLVVVVLNLLVHWVAIDVEKVVPGGNILLVEKQGELPHVKLNMEYLGQQAFRARIIVHLGLTAIAACVAYCVFSLSNIRKAVAETNAALVKRVDDATALLAQGVAEAQKRLAASIDAANAIVPDKEKKYLFVFDADRFVFYDPAAYAAPSSSKISAAIDVLLVDATAVHNLCLDPNYLHYLFERHGAENCTKVLVLDSISRGVALYVSLAHLAGYRTFIVAPELFQHRMREQAADVQEVLRGNPYVLKHDDDEHCGRYSPGRSPHANPLPISASLAKDVWTCLEALTANDAHVVRDPRVVESEGRQALASQRVRAQELELLSSVVDRRS